MIHTKTLKTACRCAQFCMLRMSTCVASFMLLSTMVSPMLKVCLSLYTLLRSHLSFAWPFVRELLYQEVFYLQYQFHHCRTIFSRGILLYLGHSVFNNRRRGSHSSRVKLPLMNMSAGWFLVSTHLIWILVSKSILSNNQSRATL